MEMVAWVYYGGTGGGGVVVHWDGSHNYVRTVKKE
jgi:hypothetical protein